MLYNEDENEEDKKVENSNFSDDVKNNILNGNDSFRHVKNQPKYQDVDDHISYLLGGVLSCYMRAIAINPECEGLCPYLIDAINLRFREHSKSPDKLGELHKKHLTDFIKIILKTDTRLTQEQKQQFVLHCLKRDVNIFGSIFWEQRGKTEPSLDNKNGQLYALKEYFLKELKGSEDQLKEIYVLARPQDKTKEKENLVKQTKQSILGGAHTGLFSKHKKVDETELEKMKPETTKPGQTKPSK